MVSPNLFGPAGPSFMVSRQRILPFALLLLSVSTVCAQTHPDGAGRFLRWMGNDTQALVSTVGMYAPALAVGAVGVVNASSSIDERLSDAAHNALGSDLPLPLEIFNESGGPKSTVFATAAFGATMLTRNQKLQDAAFTSLQSVLLAGGISYAMKATYGRSRPYDGHDADHFEAYSGNTSFPSGHTTAAFALVTPWVYYYPSPFTYSLFGVATGCAVARVAKQHHWPTDVMAGAALGFLTGRFLAKRHLSEANNLLIEPVASLKGAQLRLTYNF